MFHLRKGVILTNEIKFISYGGKLPIKCNWVTYLSLRDAHYCYKGHFYDSYDNYFLNANHA